MALLAESSRRHRTARAHSVGKAGHVAVAAILLLSILLFSGGAWATYLELSPYFSAGTTDSERVRVLASARYHAGLSSQSRQQLLEDCIQLGEGTIVRIQPSSIKNSLFQNCQGAARDFLADTPGYSLAWFVVAQTSARLKQYETFREALRESQITGPKLDWIASGRILLAEEFVAYLGTAGMDAYRKDVGELLDSAEGSKFVASRYVIFEPLRSEIVQIAEATSPQNQARFLHFVQQLSS